MTSRKYLLTLGCFVILSGLGCLAFLCRPDGEQTIRLPFLLVPFLVVVLGGSAASFFFHGVDRRDALFASAVAAMVLLTAADCVQMSYFTVDDAWISARYGHTLATTGSMSWNPSGIPVEGYTNFAWVLLAAFAELIHLNPITAFKGVGTIFGMATLVLVAVSVRRRYGRAAGATAAAILCLDPRWTMHCISGLETVPFAFTMLALILLSTSESGPNPTSRSRPWMIALLCLALSLTRPEGVLVSAVSICAVLLRSSERKKLLIAVTVAYLLPAAIYMLWRLSHFHALLPNTYYAKVARYAWNVSGFRPFLQSVPLTFVRIARDTWNAAGLRPFLQSIPLVCIAVAIGGAIGFKRRERVAVVVAALLGVFYVNTSLSMNIRDRFFMPLFPLLIVSSSLFIRWLWNMWREARTTDVWRRAAICCMTGVLLLPGLSQRKGVITFVHEYGTLMRSVHIPLGKCLSSVGGLRVAVGDAGAIPYYSRADCTDFLGLNDRSIAMMMRNGTFDAEMPSYVLSKMPDVIVLVSDDPFEVKPSSDVIRHASYIISAREAFSGYSRLLTLGVRGSSYSTYCVQVWARLSSSRYEEVSTALLGSE